MPGYLLCNIIQQSSSKFIMKYHGVCKCKNLPNSFCQKGNLFTFYLLTKEKTKTTNLCHLVSWGPAFNDQFITCGMYCGLFELFDIFCYMFQVNNTRIRTTETEVYVVSAQKHLVEHRLKLCQELWDADIKVTVTGTKCQIFFLFALEFFTQYAQYYSCYMIRFNDE